MFLSRVKVIITTVIVFLLTIIGTYSQSYNTEVEAKILIKEVNGTLSVKGIALNKTSKTKKLSYRLSVFKTDSNQSKSNKVLAPKVHIVQSGDSLFLLREPYSSGPWC